VLDGFPRTVVQAEELGKELQKKNKRIDAIVNLVINDSVIENRITGRRSCPVCGAVYHIDTLKPKTEGYCDKCKNQQLVQRPDDKPDVVRQRLKTYREQTAAVVGFYIDNGQEVIDIDADRPIDNVTAEIFEKLDSLVSAG
jgi:adenylate kinase